MSTLQTTIRDATSLSPVSRSALLWLHITTRAFNTNSCCER